MKKTLFKLVLFTLLVANVNAQNATYTFTGGSLAGLTQFGSSLTAVEDRIGVLSDAIDLNGDYLRTGSTTTTNLTMSFWIRTSTNDGNKRIIIEQSSRNSVYDNSNDIGWYTYLKNGKVGLAANYWHTHSINGSPIVNYSGYYYTESTTDLADGNWHNVIVTAQMSLVYVNSYLKRYTYGIYVDGVLENSQVVDRGSGSSYSNINASLVPYTKTMTIANNNSSNLGTNDRYQDEIDDINYYNSVVNSTVINTLANEKRCDTPSNIVVSNIGSTNADVTWDQSSNALTYDFIYVESGQPMNSGTLVSAVATNSYALTGLTSNTAYDIYVKSNCTGYSGWWSSSNAFTTLCPSTFANAVAQDITVQLSGFGLVSITPASVDNGSTVDCGALTLTLDKSDFTCSDIGVNTVTLTAEDNQGNTSTATAVVTVLGIINDETLTASQTNFCGGSNVTITTGSSMVGVDYQLRDNATNTVIGSSIEGNGSPLTFNTGVLNSTKTYNVLATANGNKGLDFDGVNDVVSTNVPMVLTSTFSIELWVKPRSNNYDRLISNYLGNNAGQMVIDTYDANNNGRGVRFYLVGTNNVVKSTTISNVLSLNSWNHVAVTFDNGTIKMYVNGILQTTSTATFTSIPANASFFHLGEDPVIGTAEHLNGQLDDVRFWTTARTISEISGNMNNCLEGTETGLYAYFKLSEGSGTTITDLVNGKVGTLTNMDASTDWVEGGVSCVSSCSAEMSQLITVTVEDITAPVADVSTLSTITEQCEVTSLNAPTATDNCAGTITGTHNVSLPLTSSTTITWTYDDGNGNTSTQTQAVVINDNIDPIADVSSLSAITSQCEVISLTAPTATDNCAGTITGTHNVSLPLTASTTITWSYKDGNGNTTTQTQSVVINDNIAPIADVSTLTTIIEQCEVTSLTAPTATDNCAGTITGTHNVSLPLTASTTITWTYDDGNGNTSTQTQSVVIDDNTAPVATVSTLSTITEQCEVTSLTAPTATDNCAGTITGTHNVSLPLTASTTITWTYDDGNGNISTQTQSVVVNDNTAPVATVSTLSTITEQCEVTSLTAPTATDNCAGTVTGTHNVSLPLTTSTTITWTYDDGNGNTTTQTQAVVINDNTAPVADVSTLSTITEQCEVTSLTAPTATDNCAGTIIGTHNVSLPLTASTTITWTYDDGNGNVLTQTQAIVINDNIDPIADISTLPSITSQCEITSLTAPTATDNCTGTIVGTHNATLPITSNTTITWTYTDGNGNTSTQTQSVVVNDNTAPVADVSTLQTITEQCEVTSLTAPTATDNCAGTIVGTHNATLPITANTTITWMYDDGNGNTSTQTQSVVVNDNTAPVATVSTLSIITEECEVTSLTAPTATDNCAGTITGTHNVTLPLTASTTITWTYDDGNGNSSTQTQSVVISGVDASVSTVNNTISATNTSADTYQWVDCNNNNAPISGATLSSFTPTTTGDYAVEITSGNCTATSVCTSIQFVGLNKVVKDEVVIYPNPAVSELRINAPFNVDQIEIYSIQGELISTEKGKVIQVSDLVTGVYMIKLMSGSEVIQRTFIKQ